MILFPEIDDKCDEIVRDRFCSAPFLHLQQPLLEGAAPAPGELLRTTVKRREMSEWNGYDRYNVFDLACKGIRAGQAISYGEVSYDSHDTELATAWFTCCSPTWSSINHQSLLHISSNSYERFFDIHVLLRRCLKKMNVVFPRQHFTLFKRYRLIKEKEPQIK